MKIKVQKRKFIRNILIGILALFVVAFIINIAPGYERNKYKDVTNLVIGDENVTEKLQKPIYIDKEGAIYISKDDIKELLDKTIYHDEKNNMIIATSEVAVASIGIGETVKNIDGINKSMLHSIIYKDDIIYIPIEEMEIIYNIQVDYIKDANVVIIDKLNEGMIKAQASEDTKIRYKQRSLSKEVGELAEGDVVSAFYTTSKGWRLIRTEDGLVGYVKANTLTNQYILRQDMHQEIETKTISVSTANGTELNIGGKKVVIKDLLKMTEEGILIKNTGSYSKDIEVWANLSIENVDLSSYSNRTKIIKNITSISLKNEIDGINVILTENEDIERFVIELAPKLREIGIITNIVTKPDVNQSIYTDIVNYIITK